ncbi:hypothetical protein EYS14_00110 [Alteromonadaceae bacterium M269]|nr:hypothetical protein EYS14_00110 [Alteromonadaceae bacterium M269]
MNYQYTIKELDMAEVIERLEKSEYGVEDNVCMNEIYEDGNLWAASPEEIVELIEEHPVLESYIWR